MKDRYFLMWLHRLLVEEHNENPHKDYMHKLRAIIIATPESQETPNVATCNNLKELEEELKGADQ